jgi:hypothetical protein
LSDRDDELVDTSSVTAGNPGANRQDDAAGLDQFADWRETAVIQGPHKCILRSQPKLGRLDDRRLDPPSCEFA